MKKSLAILAATAVTLSVPARAEQHEYQDNPWPEEAKEWECSFPKETPAKAAVDPIYKTELFLTYGDFTTRTHVIKTFNVKHTTTRGMPYQRSDQYSEIRV